eukprot:CAMPEP_0196816980 /NCGR_PEP_ID=MMETSP1362-20130617/57944_1 /TAXON_ID=163516 /ORGANISM="Leptocylindrus danicus, Strain CCMP1856" /LENGTH=751 /DNA_ID=CAMNT_0042194483 /DNA_START=392 /DNA_END=2647 /DNA_ORIENTATION=-
MRPVIAGSNPTTLRQAVHFSTARALGTHTTHTRRKQKKMNLHDDPTLMEDSDLLLHTLETSDIMGDADHDLGSMEDFGGAFESFFGLDGDATTAAAVPDAIFSATTTTTESSSSTLSAQPDRVESATADEVSNADNGMDRIQRHLDVINQALDASKQVPVVDAAMARWQRVQHMRGRSKVDLTTVSGLVPAVTESELTEITTELLKHNCSDVHQFVQTALPPVESSNGPSSSVTTQQRRSNRTVVPTAKAQENAIPDSVVSSGTGPAVKRKAPKKKRESSAKTSLPPVYTATQQHVDLPSGSDAESKRQRRLIRNRLSAALHRERKREVIDTLQRQVTDRDAEIQQMRAKLTTLSSQNAQLAKEMKLLTSHFGASMIADVLAGRNVVPVPPNTTTTPPGMVSSSDHSTTSMSSSSTGVLHSDSDASSVNSDADAEHSNTLTTKANSSKKRKTRTPTGMLVMTTLAMCSMLALVSPPSSSSTSTSSSIAKVSVSSGSTNSGGSRRRLMDYTTSTTEESSSSSSNANDDHHHQDYLLSPIEVHPHLWNMDSEGPWTTKRAHSLFDLTTTGTNNLDSKALMTPPVTPNPAFVGAAADSASSSFMFCPDAYSNLSPGFLNLSNLNANQVQEWHAGSDANLAAEGVGINAHNAFVSPSNVSVPSPSPSLFRSHRMFHNNNMPTMTASESVLSAPTANEGNNNSNTPAPFMKMLVPASAFRGSGVSGDDKSMEPWIEIGCEVKTARVVDGVDFIMAA